MQTCWSASPPVSEDAVKETLRRGSQFMNSVSSGASAPVGEPTFAKAAPVIFCVATPDARLLVGLKGVLQAVFLNHAR
jgi:hypothetical protein